MSAVSESSLQSVSLDIDARSLFSNVLLIEADRSHAKLITRVLERVVGGIEHASSAEEALRVLESKLIELVFCDLHLPDLSGLSLLRAIHEVRPNLPVIVMTSSRSLDDAISAMREGAWDYMIKQFSDDFRDRFHLVVRRAAIRQMQQMRELELKAERDAFWAAVRTSQDGLGVVDTQGNLIFANDKFYHFLHSLGEIDEEHPINVLGQIERQDTVVSQGIRTQLQEKSGDSLWRAELRISGNTEEKNEQYYELTLSSVHLGREGTSGVFAESKFDFRRYVLWVHDITAKKAQEKFQRDMLSTTSHDLKGPLGAIVTSAELLESRTLDDSRKQEIVTRIASCARGAISLIDSMLSARRIQDGMLIVKPRWYDVNEIIEEIVLDYLPVAKSKTIEFVGVPAQEGLRIYADKIGVHRVLGNLVSNAIKFTPKGGKVTLSAEHVGTELRLLVRDTGSGIEAEATHLLFQRYARLDKHQEIDGTGLGLFVTKNIVDAHNGRIEVTSQVGVGSTFIVSFPDKVD